MYPRKPAVFTYIFYVGVDNENAFDAIFRLAAAHDIIRCSPFLLNPLLVMSGSLKYTFSTVLMYRPEGTGETKPGCGSERTYL